MVRRDMITRILTAAILGVLLLIAFRGTTASGRSEAVYPDVYAKTGWARAVEIAPEGNEAIEVTAMDLEAGKYVISARLNLSSSGNLDVECSLATPAASDRSRVVLDGAETSIALKVAHVFLQSGWVRVFCSNHAGEAVRVKVKMQAVRVGTLDKVQLPIPSPSPSPTP